MEPITVKDLREHLESCERNGYGEWLIKHSDHVIVTGTNPNQHPLWFCLNQLELVRPGTDVRLDEVLK